MANKEKTRDYLAIDRNLKKFYHVKHPVLGLQYEDAEETIPTVIELLSPASDDYLMTKRKLFNKTTFDNKRGVDDTYDKYQDRVVALLVASTTGGNFKYKGEPISRDNAEEFYKDRDYQYLREDIEGVTANMKAFLQPW
jgi:hypothetical protein